MLKSKELLRAQQLAEGVHVDPRHEIVAAELVKGTSQTQLAQSRLSGNHAMHQSKKIRKRQGRPCSSAQDCRIADQPGYRPNG